MTQINHEDALGADVDDLGDQQGRFNANQASPAAPAKSGGGAAKVFLIVFVLILVAFLGWVGWRIVNGAGEGANVDTLSLQAPEMVESVPMTGAPGPNDATAPAAVGSFAPEELGPMDQVTQAPVGQQSEQAPVEALLPPATELAAVTQAAALTSQPATVPAAVASAPVDTAALKDQLHVANLRVGELETQLRLVKAQLPQAKPKRPTVRRRPATPKATTARVVSAASPPVQTAQVARAQDTGVVLKAVLDGRAWLQLRSGETITVAPGDDVAGVRVQTIDAERGVVVLSNGTTLR